MHHAVHTAVVSRIKMHILTQNVCSRDILRYPWAMLAHHFAMPQHLAAHYFLAGSGAWVFIIVHNLHAREHSFRIL